jgi:hypothetical protein
MPDSVQSPLDRLTDITMKLEAIITELDALYDAIASTSK